MPKVIAPAFRGFQCLKPGTALTHSARTCDASGTEAAMASLATLSMPKAETWNSGLCQLVLPLAALECLQARSKFPMHELA